MSLRNFDTDFYKKLGKNEHVNKKTKTIVSRNETVGKIITKLRLTANYTQKEISDAVGVAQQTYAGYERGKHEPSIETLIRLSEIYRVSLDYITGRYLSNLDESFDPDLEMDTLLSIKEERDRIENILEKQKKYNRAKKK